MQSSTSKVAMLPKKSLAIWKNINKQCIRSNTNIDLVNRSLKGLFILTKRSFDGLSRSLDKVNQSLEEINDTLLEGFKKLPPKIILPKSKFVIEQAQQAVQSQQIAIRMLNASPAVKAAQAANEKGEEKEKEKESNWWEGLEPKEKEKEEKEEKEKKEKKQKAKDSSSKRKKEAKKVPEPAPVVLSPTALTPDRKFSRSLDLITSFNKAKSMGGNGIIDMARSGDSNVWTMANSDARMGKNASGQLLLPPIHPAVTKPESAVKSHDLIAPFDTVRSSARKLIGGSVQSEESNATDSNSDSTTSKKDSKKSKEPKPESKLLQSLKGLDLVTPFNAIKSFGENAVKNAAQPGDVLDWDKLNDNFDSTMGKIGEKALGPLRLIMDTLNQAMTSGQFMPIIDAMANGFLFIANVIRMVVDGLLWLVGVIQNNWSVIRPILEAIAIVYLVAIIVQIYTMAAAWLVANWPILILIAVIAVLIYIFQQLGVTAADVVGAITGAFGWLVAFGQNVGIAILNGWNSLCDGIINGFNIAVNFVQKLWYGLSMGTLDILYNMTLAVEGFAGGFMKVMAKAIKWVIDKFNDFIDLLNKIPFFGELGIRRINVGDWNPETPHAASDLIDQKRQALAQHKPPDEVPLRNTEKQNYIDMGEQFNIYSQYGKDFANSFMAKGRDATKKVTEMVNGVKNMTGSAPTAAPAYTSIAAQNNNANNNINRVNEVGRVNETVDISSEDLKMMRELAEIQAIQNFVELTPTVQMTTGNINNAGDIDTIINKIGQKLNEEFISTAQGVYT